MYDKSILYKSSVNTEEVAAPMFPLPSGKVPDSLLPEK